MAHKITWHETIDIDARPEAVYDFITDLNKDPQWRTEVNRMDVDGPSEIGTVATEYSTLFFGRFVKTVTATRIVTLEPSRLLVVETDAEADTWLRSTRTVTPRSNNASTFSYDLETEVRPGGPIGKTYGSVLQVIYKPRLARYLTLLKHLVETDSRLNS